MINQQDHYVAWAMLIFELEDAREHLESLVSQLATDGSIDEEDFQIQIGHVFRHLNVAWHSRNDANLDSATGDDIEQRRRFPTDIDPL